MKIEKDTVVTLRYKVSDLQGKLIEEAKEPTATSRTRTTCSGRPTATNRLSR